MVSLFGLVSKELVGTDGHPLRGQQDPVFEKTLVFVRNLSHPLGHAEETSEWLAASATARVHRGVKDPHGHGFLEGPGKNERGPSLDPEGTVVPEDSGPAHWPIKK